MKRALLGLSILTAMLGCVPAFAVDGVVLINQASVMAAGGFPFTIIQSGSYKLSGNLAVPAETDGIDIIGSGVTLDLNGFTISGAIVCEGQNCFPSHTVDSKGIDYVKGGTTIRNGHVTGFAVGVEGFLGNGQVEEIHATGNARGGIEVFDTLVRHNNASRNGGFGLSCSGCTVVENVINSNGRNGVSLSGGTFSGNVIDSNGAANAIGQAVVSLHNNACNDTGC